MTKSMMTGKSLVLVGLLLALGACGDDDDSGGASGQGGSSGAAGTSGEGGGDAGGAAGSDAAGTGGTGGVQGPTLAEFGAQLGEATCGLLNDCGGFVFKNFLGATCSSLAQGKFEAATLAAWQTSIDSGRVVYDASKVSGCLADLKAQGCKAGAHYSEACEQVLAGKVADGQPCVLDIDCAGASACDPGKCPGTCAPRSAEGSPCLVNNHCQEGLACNTTTGKCAKPAAVGGSCGQGITCDLNAFCLGADDAKKTPGTCKTYADFYSAASGASCDVLKGPYCGENLACAVTNTTTLATTCVALAATGGECSLALPDMCAPSDYCDGLKANDAKTKGTCKVRPGEGQACGTTLLGATCAAGLVCETATKKCVALAKNDAACTENGVCLSGFCNTDKKCAAPPSCVAP